jgi:predicted small lipoprotein YifL
LLGMRILRMRAARHLLLALLLAGLMLAAAACGRKGAPEPPPGADYPRTYPSH